MGTKQTYMFFKPVRAAGLSTVLGPDELSLPVSESLAMEGNRIRVWKPFVCVLEVPKLDLFPSRSPRGSTKISKTLVTPPGQSLGMVPSLGADTFTV